MKRFVWRLQRVLNIKTKEEQTKRAELLKITEKLAQTRSELIIQRRILENIIKDLTDQHPKERLGKQEFFLRCSAINNKVIERLKNKIGELESAQKQKIAEVLKIRKFKKGLEKLRTEAKTRFMKEQERLEQKELDKITTIGFARKIMQQGKFSNSIG